MRSRKPADLMVAARVVSHQWAGFPAGRVFEADEVAGGGIVGFGGVGDVIEVADAGEDGRVVRGFEVGVLFAGR